MANKFYKFPVSRIEEGDAHSNATLLLTVNDKKQIVSVEEIAVGYEEGGEKPDNPVAHPEVDPTNGVH